MRILSPFSTSLCPTTIRRSPTCTPSSITTRLRRVGPSTTSRTSATGVVMSTYVPVGDVALGSFAQPEPSAQEVQRRAKLAREAG